MGAARSLLYVEDIAERLGITTTAVRLRVFRRRPSIPKPLPKERTEGKLAWRVRDFEKWLDQLDRRIAR